MTACDQKVYEPAKSAPVKTPAESEPGEIGGEPGEEPARERGADGGGEVHAEGGLASGEPHDEVPDREIQGISLARRNLERTAGVLESRRVAEVQRREQCGPIQRECTRRDHRGCDQPLPHHARDRRARLPRAQLA